MPFKSQAQRRKFAQLLVQGKISNETFEEWNRETGGRKLPEHAAKTTSKNKKKTTTTKKKERPTKARTSRKTTRTRSSGKRPKRARS